ncbi:MAG: 3-oxoacyl-ACP synthase [Alphaproteobacteria bacterium RIFCSPHIGHO2_01_FULL_41_14]|nr:MAG: 3-oxoacyl-ACP synthase [Alphaproteobacteria bacterium GWB1_45_5]OFW76769.1 MAG: 3-oxoacyl-ACP synthase [Alphaproteobacteria bacterium GWA1_45_9]OFW89851.1 MAG: 3-oxoacyl-ACP synthase [Alphaproteobacteria bacterium RIFCSPHIGHO2_01_FULL_41_14]HCI48985.1 3-oxoacyl-ACP synthase [Holosporales bacterium]
MDRTRIIGTGSYLPQKIVTNYDLEKIMETSHDWIAQRTGIHQRHVAAEDEFTSHMGIKASQKAMIAANIQAEDIDFIICATTTPDLTFPATAVRIQSSLGAKNAFAFDIQAVCSGFIYALSLADNFIRTGQCRRGLVIGAEKMSRILDWSDRGTAILFGDGAGAVVVEHTDDPTRGILSTHLHSDGSLCDILYTDGGAATSDQVGKVRMVGREVFKHAVLKLVHAMSEALESNHLSSSDVDWFVPHQANERIIDAVAERLNFPENKIIKTVRDHANTSAASIPLALDWGVRQGKIKEGDLVLTDALGAGLSWGSALIRW